MNHHAIEVFENGSVSVRDLRLGETMHSSIGPVAEAEQVYLAQTRFAERLQDGSADPLVLYDVGMGIAVNALAAIECRNALPKARALRVFSFENDLEGLRLALSSIGDFPILSRNEHAVRLLLKERRWRSPDGAIEWILKEGDFRSQELEVAPEIIFFDFFSPKSAPELWKTAVFRKLYEACRPRIERGLSSVLTTYSMARRARSAMTDAGFQVLRGQSTSAKRETTVAFT